ncbi:hypothetical protein [Scleromatobacter humisilvae]|uniref:J domain-containing protein n=1 Tax=Scleromatobacter humisilvae TaxID=2897159 RepID=A0A9X2BYJ6_9BURK|nr:hypothetical protein [Scleromatobacter humisilvae]MCK9685472.1 hypothetical protein [Scleromatobacter humisilvae]
MTPWQTLGVATDVAVPELRRRYAALIKEFRPETHPQDFARIREAYEVVLPHARRREALAAERAEEAEVATAQVEAVAQAGIDAVPLATGAAAPVEVIAPPPVEETPAEQDAEPALAAHFRRFHGQAAAATGSDDEAHLPALRELLAARTQATLDDSQALEFALMRWFIEADAPPLTLLFETGRAFDWHRHPARLSSWLSPWALRQMEARLALSRDLVHARHFSGNAWLRRLHSTRPGRLMLVWRPAAVEAGFWAERWRNASEDADARPLAACLNPVALQRMRGPASTDLLVGLAVAAFAPDLGNAAVWALVATAIVFGLRRLLQVIAKLPETHRARVVARAILGNKIIVGIVAVVGAWLAAIVSVTPEPGSRALAVAALLGTPLALLVASLAWRVAAWIELALAMPFQWREAVDRLEFDGLVRSNATPPGRPFGRRLGFLKRLASMRAALRLQPLEIATRERPPRARPFTLVKLGQPGGGQNRWRMLWFGAWVLFALLRLVHAFGGGN